MKKRARTKSEDVFYKFGNETDIDLLKSVISLLDGYRIHRFADTKRVEKDIFDQKLGARFAKDWKEISRILEKMARFPLSLPRIRKLIKREIIVDLLRKYFTVAALILIFIFFSARFSLGGFEILYVYVLMFSVFALTTLLTLKQYYIRKIALAIKEHFEENPEKFSAIRLRLKKTTQKLIYGLCDLIRKSNRNPEDHSFTLDNIDYKGITVIKTPGRLRKYYIVIPRIDEPLPQHEK